MSHIIPRKRLGQHFLIDQSVIEQIVAFIDPRPTDNLIEIGPGMGALTAPLLERVQSMSVIELDRRLVSVLEKLTPSIYAEDALSFDFSRLSEPEQRMRIVGNLPYNISTPLLFHLLKYTDDIQDMHFMLQKEVVDRLAAAPNSEHYGRLSVMIQYQCAATPLLLVPPEAFQPPPKVESKVVRLIPYRSPLTRLAQTTRSPESNLRGEAIAPSMPCVALDKPLFANVVRQAFAMRRKTLRNALKKWVDPQIWEITQIDNQLRPEVLSVKDYVELCNAITRYQRT